MISFTASFRFIMPTYLYVSDCAWPVHPSVQIFYHTQSKCKGRGVHLKMMTIITIRSQNQDFCLKQQQQSVQAIMTTTTDVGMRMGSTFFSAAFTNTSGGQVKFSHYWLNQALKKPSTLQLIMIYFFFSCYIRNALKYCQSSAPNHIADTRQNTLLLPCPQKQKDLINIGIH